MFRPKEKTEADRGLGEPKGKVLSLFRSVMRFQAFKARVANATQDLETPETYMIAKKRMHEIETEKAFITKVSNHDKWKAGGPY
jgi:hypothetical protein